VRGALLKRAARALAPGCESGIPIIPAHLPVKIHRSYLLIPAVLILAAAALSQPKIRPVFSHSLLAERNAPDPSFSARSLYAFPETLRVLGAMFAFQEDSDDRTTGSGSFDLGTSLKKIIDPPPHDGAYFQKHLEFLENYYRKVSHGKLIVKGTMLEGVYRLANKMQYYSPQKNSTANAELGKLMQDAWRNADSLSGGTIPFEQYDAFLIFHAGAGRDIDFVSIYGYDPTPFDLPSIYLNLKSLQKMFGSSYKGVPVRHDSLYITNSMIIPETENRELSGVGGTSLLQLGINGLLAASVGSHLGLPDLFDTKTGQTGIGRFGLMDGQSIFSWNGLFPPEPCAWEKYFLGWAEPVDVYSGDSVYNFPAASLPGASDTIYKIPISSKEYFLAENRNRDAKGDGARITVVFNGETVEKRWNRDMTGFNAFNQDSLYGVITDVDEFDWSLPGGVNTRTNEFFDGGILIWHIDENVINSGYAQDAVNANPERRGVNLMEADGSQDIGQSYGFLGAGSGSEEGTVLDFWYAGNSAPLRQKSDEFSPISHPSSLSNDLANSHIYIRNFSGRAPRMTARITVGDEKIAPLSGYPKILKKTFGKNSLKYAPRIGTASGGQFGGVLLAVSERSRPVAGVDSVISEAGPSLMYSWKTDGTPLEGYSSTGLIARAGSDLLPDEFTASPLITDYNLHQSFDIAAGVKFYNENSMPPGALAALKSWSLSLPPQDSLARGVFANYPKELVTTSLSGGDTVFAFGTQKGLVNFVSQNGLLFAAIKLYPGDSTDIVGVSLWERPDKFIAVSSAGTVGIVSPAGVVASKNFNVKINSPAASAVMFNPVKATSSSRVITGAGKTGYTTYKNIAFCSESGLIFLLDEFLNTSPGFPVSTGGEIMSPPAMADFDMDGVKDIIVFSANKIHALNAVGAYLENFPVTVSSASTILSSPVVADLDGAGSPEIIAVTQEGLVAAIDRSGKMAEGFPLLVGENRGSTPVVFSLLGPEGNFGIGLAAASDDGNVYGWKTGTYKRGSTSVDSWPQYMHDGQNTGFNDLPGLIVSPSGEFFPVSRAYNWPNPVGAKEGFVTHIRYYVSADANVHVRIFDMAGDLVAELAGFGTGGMDNEIQWGVSGIQSGVYFARIEATGSKESGVAVIKIAVVK